MHNRKREQDLYVQVDNMKKGGGDGMKTKTKYFDTIVDYKSGDIIPDSCNNHKCYFCGKKIPKPKGVFDRDAAYYKHIAGMQIVKDGIRISWANMCLRCYKFYADTMAVLSADNKTKGKLA
jgi:hypothetical protein